MELMLNLAAPQPGYAQAIEAGGIIQPMEGLTVTFSRALTDHVLRHHELFSSVGGIDLGNIRPLTFGQSSSAYRQGPTLK